MSAARLLFDRWVMLLVRLGCSVGVAEAAVERALRDIAATQRTPPMESQVLRVAIAYAARIREERNGGQRREVIEAGAEAKRAAANRRGMGAREEVLEFLEAHGGSSYAELAKEMHISEAAARQRVLYLARKGLIASDGNTGRKAIWTIAPAQPAQNGASA